ncbi:MAG: hypothetical protein ACREBV_06560 [Candidatus Zixiibacteriota bacterium]
MKKQVIILVAFFVAFYGGCGEKQNSIVDSNHKQTPSDEVPAEVRAMLNNYSDPENIDLFQLVAAVADTGFDDINDSIYDAYLVTFLWGKLINFGPPVNAAFSWDGSLSVNGPSIVQSISTIDFEHGEDSLIEDNLTSAESWGSFTDNEFDGAIFLVLYDKVTPTFAPQILTFNTPPITLQFDFSQLVQLLAYYEVHPVYGVAVAAHKVRLHNCREGYLEGRWVKSDSSEFTGTFQGLWFAANGDTIGVYSGNFWKTNDGAQLLEGWVSGLYTDQVIAELHGIWYFDDYRLCPMCGSGHGQFKGRLQLSHSDEHGYFQGEFGDYSLPPNDRNMPMQGKWHLDCVNLVIDDLPPSN